MVQIAHISDFHCGNSLFSEKKLARTVREVNKLKPDVVIISGDITNMGFETEYKLAKKYIDKLKPQKMIIPGNHDARYVGYEFFEKYFGKGNQILRLPGIGLIGIDSTVPDLDEGNVGRGKLRWLTDKIDEIPEQDLKILVLHHHLLPVPDTGRERSVIADAGTVLKVLVNAGINLTLSGHKHTPHAWFLNNVGIITAGSCSSTKLRANIKNSYNIIEVNQDHIDVHVKEVGGRRKLLAKYHKAKDSEEFRLKSL